MLKVDGEVFIERHGKSYSGFSVRWYFPGDVPDDFALVYQNRNYGLYIVAGTSKNDTLVMAAPYLKLSALPGEQWEVPVISYDRVTGTFSMTQSKLIDCVSTNAQYSTPAGDFTCIEFHWRERPEPDVSEIWDHYSYWAPGVGLVGEVVISSANNRINYRSVLCDFTIL